MSSTPQGRTPAARHLARSALRVTLLATLVSQAYAQQAAAPAQQLDTVVVTGIRASLLSSATDKKNAIEFVDTINAEDMGKFPDQNIAEAISRIPGLTVSREISGEGLQVQIRGLGTSFTRILMNGAPIASASTGRTDAQSANREVDMDFLPGELFNKVTVSKSPTASMLEGGAAGIVDMRSVRPFDKRGFRSAFQVVGTKNAPAKSWGSRGSAIVSNTWDNKFGALVGLSWANNKVNTSGFETIGWTNAGLSATQSASATRNSTGGGNWTIPGTVPANAGSGLVTGEAINEAFLLAKNPGASITQIDNGLIPRLGRRMASEGTRDRLNAVVSLEARPNDDLELYLDVMAGKKKNKIERSDMNWVGRFGAMVPLNLQFDRSDCGSGCVVTKGTFTNAQWFLEYRPYTETTIFQSFNPGLVYQISDNLKVDAQINSTRSDFHRESPTVLLITPGSSGVTVEYDNTTGTPVINTNISLNDPTKFQWNGGRLNMQDEKRWVRTEGGRFNFTYGDKNFMVKAGAAYDDVSRRITSLNGDAYWENLACRRGLNVFLPAPNTTNGAGSGCNGTGTAGAAAASYPGYGAGLTAGASPASLQFQGPLIPNGSVQNYLHADPRGFIGLDWDKFRVDSGYDKAYGNTQVSTGSTNTGTNPGYIQEKVTSFYVETAGRTRLFDNRFAYNLGLRHARTEQTFGTLISTADPRNAQLNLGDGGRFPNLITEELTPTSYSNNLPSGTLAYNLRDDVLLRLSGSKTMTRPNPQDLRRTQLQFSDPSAAQATLTNSDLKPYISKNWDLGLEWYTGREGYLAAAFFKKDITAFTSTQNTTYKFGELAQWNWTYAQLTQQQRDAIAVRSGLAAGLTSLSAAQTAAVNAQDVLVSQQVNSDALLKVNGMELSWVQPLTFLPVQGFGFTANYTKVKQRATNNSGFIALGVPPHTYNLTAYYDAKGISFRVAQTFTKGSQGSTPGQNGIGAAAIFGTDYKQVDVSSRVDLSRFLGWTTDVSMSLDVNNVTKSIQRAYFQFENAPFTIYDPGRTYAVGLRVKY